MKLSIGRAAKELGVSRETLRKWETEGKIAVERAPNGRRRYELEDLVELAPNVVSTSRLTLAYARVSEDALAGSLERQIALLESFCAINEWTYDLIHDVGSGVNFRNPGLKELIRRICAGEVDRLVVTSANRLPRIGSDLVFSLCEQFGTEVVMLNAHQDTDSNAELSKDVMEIVTLFCARLHGDMSDDNSSVISRLRKLSEDLRRN